MHSIGMPPKPRSSSSKDPGKIVDFYKRLPSRYARQTHNPCYARHNINLPFRMCIIGGSGSGKTNVAMEIIRRMENTFNKLVICCKSSAEPLYEYLSEKIPSPMLEIHEGIENVPPCDTFSNEGQTLVIFDDLVMDKKQDVIEQYFIRGRKIGKGISCMYLSQSYFKTPKTIRINCNYILLKKLSSKRDLKMILSEWGLGRDLHELEQAYTYATRDPLYFLLIDTEGPEEKKFRRGFIELI
jgi:hypothetical protein